MRIEYRGHIWTSPGFSEAAQKPAMAGCDAYYVDKFEDALKSLRAKNRLRVKDARGCGRTEKQIEKNVDKVHAKGAAVVDEQGRLSTNKKQRAAMVADAVKKLANERRGPHKRTKKDRRMPWDQVAPLYYRKTLSNAELEEAVTADGKYSPMSYHTMRRHFGQPRGALVGRPSAERRAAIV